MWIKVIQTKQLMEQILFYTWLLGGADSGA